jgi:predicted transcriptional regulator YheO
MIQQLTEIRNNILSALEQNDNILAKMYLNYLDILLHDLSNQQEEPKQYVNEETSERYEKLRLAYDKNYCKSNDIQDLKESYYYKGRRDESIKQKERIVSKESYEDALNMQKASNAGYESKIKELKRQLKEMYSEEDIENIWNEFVKELPPINNGSSSDFLDYIKKFKKK